MTDLAESRAEDLRGFTYRGLRSTRKEAEAALGFLAGRGKKAREAERSRQAMFIRCIVGNPFRPTTLDPAWRAETVVALARGIYDERAFDRLPILADALQDAGCYNDDILNHCRDTGPHARGCWVVDLVLGKS